MVGQGTSGDLPALKKYRPDLKVLLLDCPPTGLVACYGLDSNSTVLQDNYGEIIKEFSGPVLDESGLRELRSVFPLVDTRRLLETCGDIGLIFERYPQSSWKRRQPDKASDDEQASLPSGNRESHVEDTTPEVKA